KGRAKAASEYPKTTNPLRHPERSDHAPDHSRKRLDTESATPSITPKCILLPCKTPMRNAGISGKIISLAMSLMRLARLRILTLRGSFQERPESTGGDTSCVWFIEQVFSPRGGLSSGLRQFELQARR